MSARDWVIVNLQERLVGAEQYRVARVGELGFRVIRAVLPEAHVCCPDGMRSLITIDDFDRAIEAYPATQFVVVLRGGAANDVYPYAEERGIAVGRFGDLVSALRDCDDISDYTHRERRYVARRLLSNPAIVRLQRVGENAYEVVRAPKLTPNVLVVATFDTYETTADDVLLILERYGDLGLDAIIATNPSISGVGEPASYAARNAGVKLLLMKEFLNLVARSWQS